MSSTALAHSSVHNKFTRTTTPPSDSPVTRAKLDLRSTISLPPSLANLTPQRSPSAASPSSHPSPAPSTPGRWQHPRMDEIIRRQNATHFDSSNVRMILLNSVLVLVSLAIPPALACIPLDILHTFSSVYPYYLLLAFRAFFALNIFLATFPLLRSPDLCEDIPLTPQQRHTLNLPPSTRPLTPLEQSQLHTPPRYSRPPTPSTTDSLRVQASPFAFTDSRSSRNGSPSPFADSRGSGPGTSSPRSNSPLASKFYNPGSASRASYSSGLASPLAASDFDSLATPPAKSGRASVALNSKWLYERGRNSPGVAGAGWGTGSVFN